MPAARVVSTRAAPSSRPGSTSFAPDHPTPAQPSSASLPDGNASPTVKRQRYSASTRRVGKRTPPLVHGHTKRQPSRHPPVFPTGTPVQPPNAGATAQANDRKAGATSFGIAVSTRAARSSRPGSTTFGERDSPCHIRADSINSMENGHKNRGFCPPFGHFLKSTPPQPRHRP